MPPAAIVCRIGVLVVQHAGLGVDPPTGVACEPVLRGDPDHAVGSLSAVQSAGGWPLHNLDVGDLLGIDVVDAGRLLAAGVHRQRLAVVLDANTVNVVDRFVAERQAGLTANADPGTRSDRTTLLENLHPRCPPTQCLGEVPRARDFLDLAPTD